jgi:hypothetical protein
MTIELGLSLRDDMKENKTMTNSILHAHASIGKAKYAAFERWNAIMEGYLLRDYFAI